MVESGPAAGRDRLGAPRRDARAARHPLLRHGRHDGEGRADPGRPAVGDEGLQRRRPRRRGDRRHVALRLPGADAGRRPRRDRRRRRLDRLGRLGRAAPGRPAERRRRPRPGLLPARRHRADGDRRERRARTAQPGVLPRRRDRARRRGRARGRSRSAARRRSGSTSPRPRTGSSRSRTRPWSTRCTSSRSSAATTRATSCSSASAAPGPVHANALARDAEMPTLLIPRSPGIFSATGLLTTDLKRDTATTIMRRLDDLDHARGGGDVRARSRRRGGPSSSGRASAARRSSSPPGRPALRRPELRADDPRRATACSSGSTQSTTAPTGSAPPSEPVEVVSLRLTSIGRIAKPPRAAARARRRGRAEGARPVYFAEAGDYVDCPIYDRYALAGRRDASPDRRSWRSSTRPPSSIPASRVRVDDVGNLVIEREAA